MPASVKYLNKKWRVVEANGSLVRNKAGTPVDGGGHSSKQEAINQMLAINISQGHVPGVKSRKKK